MAGVKGIQRFDHLPALGRRIADSALAVMATKEPGKAFFMHFAVDITPVCDCYGWTDTPGGRRPTAQGAGKSRLLGMLRNSTELSNQTLSR
jgi:hypothetical protein